MTAKINTLIDKQDNFEIVRDKVALILAEEKENQKILALGESKDPDLWDFNVYIERAIPWQLLEDSEGNVISETPLVNVYYDTGNFIQNKSGVVERQAHEAIIIIDAYSAKNNIEVDGVTTPGDLRAALDSDRVIRLIRNILMAGEYTYLDLRGIVWQRWLQDIRKFRPAIEDRPAMHVMAARLTLRVLFNEFSPQAIGEDFEEINVELNTDTGGQVLINIDTT